MNQVTLPDKPSELLAIALEDLELCEMDPVYEIDMGEFHKPDGAKCLVCFAGSVLAKRFEISPDVFWNDIEEELDDADLDKIMAIDYLRGGCMEEGGEYLGVEIPLSDRSMPPYESPNFKPAIRQLITDLAKVGC